jgi:threonine synthase
MDKKVKVYFQYQCIACESTFPADQFYRLCPKCQSLLILKRDEERIDWHVGRGREAQNYFDSIRYGKNRGEYPNGSGVFMWLPHLLPGFPVEAVVSLREGHTDLFETPDWFKKRIGMKNLFVKMEGQLPSESFKDRGMCVAVSDALRLRELSKSDKRWTVLCASTGDTSASAAMYAAYARDRLQCVVILPYGGVSQGQLFQVRAAGATIIFVDDKRGFDACMKMVEEFCARHPDTVIVNSENPLRIVGQESIALEICQDLRWQAPDWIAVPCGNGGNLTALTISLIRMRQRGLINKLPGIIVAQAEVANTLVRWGRSEFQHYEPGTRQSSVASAMNIQDPVSFPRIKKLYQRFDMRFYDVPEDRINTTRGFWMSTGADVCPQTAVALDAVMQAHEKGVIRASDKVVVIGTASGLKFPTSEGLRYQEKKISASISEMESALL